MLEESLQQRGYAVASATDAGEARELLLRRPADLLIADPPGDSRVARRELEDLLREFPEVPSILVSPESFDPAVLSPNRVGEAPHRQLRRPFTLNELLLLTDRLVPADDGRGRAPNR